MGGAADGRAAAHRHLTAAAGAALGSRHSAQGLTVEAALSGDPEPAIHAAMLDPHTAAELTLEEIRALMGELLAAHGARLAP